MGFEKRSQPQDTPQGQADVHGADGALAGNHTGEAEHIQHRHDLGWVEWVPSLSCSHLVAETSLSGGQTWPKRELWRLDRSGADVL